MRHLKERIERLIESSQITDEEEKERLTYLIKVKKWNPYCIRHLGDKSMFNLLVPNATMVSLADRYDFSVKWLHENALSYFTKLTGGEIKDTSENHDGDSGDSRDSGDN